MKEKETEQKDVKVSEQPLVYTDAEVSGIMTVLGQIYALDDAIYNQEQLHRPETYIDPIRTVRKDIANHLVHITSKGKPEEKQPEPQA